MDIIYFNSIQAIGGIEAWLYYLSVYYRDYDIAVVYKNCDPNQLYRLSRNFRCIKYNGPIECNRAFFCFNTDIIDEVKANEKFIVIHGDYEDMVKRKQLNIKALPIIDGVKYLGVSKTVCDSWTRLTGIPCELCYNPIVPPTPQKILKLVYCGRLTSEKGGKRVERLIRRLKERGIEYRLYVYSNGDVNGENITRLNTRLDVANYLNPLNYDFILVPSDNEGYCYSLVEALSNGLPAIVTPCPVFKELGCNDENSILLEFDCSNIDKVIDKMTNEFRFTFKPPQERWEDFFSLEPTTYEGNIMKKIKALMLYQDTYENILVEKGQIYETTKERADLIVSKGFAEFAEEEPTIVKKVVKTEEKAPKKVVKKKK